MRRATARIAAALAGLAASAAMAHAPVPTAPAWQDWSATTLDRAQASHRFVLLDLEAVWCHWCHVMDQVTYADPSVQRLLAARYLAVRVDQDADPALSNRYGDWGWPATIVLAADGSEIVKRRGYLPPDAMASMLQAIIDDPSPGPSVSAQAAIAPVSAGRLDAASRTAELALDKRLYDGARGGWGDGQKYVDAFAMERLLRQALEGDAGDAARARQTLDANLNLIDPVAGGVYQYSDQPDWHSPHYEKIVSFQADDLRLYAMAYALWGEPRYLDAAGAIRRYATRMLRAPGGAFYVSQDADVSAALSGHAYYAMNAAGRGRSAAPRIDRHRYARENGWMVSALCRYADVTGDGTALAQAGQAALWIETARWRPDGGFRHGLHDAGGPYLGDSVAMAQAELDLYRSTAERAWLARALRTLAFIDARFRDPAGGYFTAPPASGARGVFRTSTRLYEENVALVRAARLAAAWTGEARQQAMAEHAMAYLVALAHAQPERFMPGILLADDLAGQAPLHVTIVGARGDAAAAALYAQARRLPVSQLQLNWWDPATPYLAGDAVRYPRLARAAAFTCTATACSRPVFEPQALRAQVDRSLRPQPAG